MFKAITSLWLLGVDKFLGCRPSSYAKCGELHTCIGPKKKKFTHSEGHEEDNVVARRYLESGFPQLLGSGTPEELLSI